MPLDFIAALAELRPLEGIEPDRLAGIRDVEQGLVRLAVQQLAAARSSPQDVRKLTERQERLNRRGMELLGLWSP